MFQQALSPVNKDRVRLFVEALSSDRFAPTLAFLHKPMLVQGEVADCYCPLGVGIEVAIENGLPVRVERETCYDTQSKMYLYRKVYDGEYVALPPRVQRWYGFASTDPAIVFSGNLTTIMNAHDSLMPPFWYMADAIAKFYLST